jgi:polar amino acid transport system substrate-binding protein
MSAARGGESPPICVLIESRPILDCMKRYQALAAILFFASMAAAQNTLRVMTIEYPPFYQDIEGRQGIACDILREALKAENIQVEYVFMPPMRMLRGIGETVTLSGSGGILREKYGDLAISESLLEVRQVFLYDGRKHADGVDFETVSALTGYLIGVLEKSGTEEYLRSFAGLRLVPNSGNEGLARQLEGGRIDLWATVDIAGYMTLSDLFPAERAFFKATKAFQESGINVIIPLKVESETHYGKLINAGLDTIRKNGTYRKILEGYLGDFESPSRYGVR